MSRRQDARLLPLIIITRLPDGLRFPDWLHASRRVSVPTALFLLMIAWMVVACVTNSAATPSTVHSPLLGHYSYTPVGQDATSSHSEPGGQIVFADTQFPDTLNPLFADMPIDFTLDNALWAAPVFFDQQFHVHADQLTEVPLPQNGDVLDGGRTIIMRLRHDLRWSDGQSITSGDFRYWWQLEQDPNTGAITSGGYSEIASIDTPDAYTVVLHMKQPFGPYLLYLPYAAPRHAWSKLPDIALQNTPAVFTLPTVTDGPYKLEQTRNGPGQTGPGETGPRQTGQGQTGQGQATAPTLTMLPNSYYRSTTFHGPFASRLIYRAYANTTQLMRAAQQGQVNVAEGYGESEAGAINRSLRAATGPQQAMLEAPTAAYEHLDFNLAHPFLQDARVRRAIQMAINVCGMLAAVLHAANCARRVSQVEPLPSLVYDPAIQASPYNPTAARALLLQAGWQPNAQGLMTKDGHTLTIRLVTTTDNPIRAALAQYIQRDLHSIGIQVSVAAYGLGAFFGIYTKKGVLATGNYDMALFTYANGPDPDDEYDVFDSSQIPSADNPYGGNYGRVNDPIIDQALTNGRAAVSFANRVAYYHQFLERLAAQVYSIPLYTELNFMTVSANVHNVIPNPNQPDNTWNIADWWIQSSV
ncbi:MAG: peptide ABC transporter substrate-binding protein [Ktedonobacteraceae bacterium]